MAIYVKRQANRSNLRKRADLTWTELGYRIMEISTVLASDVAWNVFRVNVNTKQC
jgi:hypothetical protein